MLDTSVLNPTPSATLVNSDFLETSAIAAANNLHSGLEPFLTPNPPNELALHSDWVDDLQLDQKLEETVSASSQVLAGTTAELLPGSPELPIFRTSERYSRWVANERAGEEGSDFLTGIGGNEAWVGSLTSEAWMEAGETAMARAVDLTFAAATSTQSWLPITDNQTINGTLSSADPNNPSRPGRYHDDYLLSGVSAGQTVSVNLTADFDTYLQLVNAATGEVIAFDDDSGSGLNSRLGFTVESGIDYLIRVTSFWTGATGDYTLATESVTLPEGYDLNYGYGLVDAAAAIGHALGRSPLLEVPDLGGNNWGLDLVNAPEAWAQGFTGEDTVVAVIDTGVDYTHVDLDDNLWVNSGEIAGNGIDDDGNGYVDDVRGWDFVEDDNNPMDLRGHGTHVAGTIAAENNGFGVTGVAYNAQIMPVRVLNENGSGFWSDVADGIIYAADNGADVINLSLGGGYSSAIEAAVEYATALGSVVVMAAGNSGASQPTYPANFATDWGIAVGAVNSSNRMAWFSNQAGTTPLDYVVAPGVSVLSTTPGNAYASYSGTSMAAPHVAGVAALLLSANPHLTSAQVESILTATANSTSVTV